MSPEIEPGQNRTSRPFFLLQVTPRLRWLLWFGYVAIWTALLTTPFPESVEWPLFDPPVTEKYLIAKIGHVCAYALMAILTGWLRTGWQARLLLLFFLMAHGSVTEWVQLHLANRTGTVMDIVLNHLGILAGLVLSWKWWTQPK